MFSVKTAVDFMASHDHLPPQFPVAHGLRTFFPPVPSRSFNVSSLTGYLLYRSAVLTDDTLRGVFEVGADGAGRWALKVALTGGTTDQDYGIGFMFDYSPDTVGHGYVHVASHEFVDNETLTVAITGVDRWITMNWIEAFAGQLPFYLSSTDSDASAGLSELARLRGSSDVAILDGATVSSFSNYAGGGLKPPPPGFGINFGTGYELPPFVDQ